jgi:branched-chain amino acid transport system ATP-binding protein
MPDVGADRIVQVIGRLADRGIAVVLVEHNMSVVASVSHRVLALDAGMELARGTPTEVMNDPRVARAYLG